MSLQVLSDLAQRSDEWYAARCGIVTASVVGRLITVRKLGAIDFDCSACGATATNPCLSKRGTTPSPIKTLHPERTPSAANKTMVIEPAVNIESRALAFALVAERANGFTDDNYVGLDMLRGIDDEPRAVDLYDRNYAPVTTVGFMVRDDWGFRLGYSPDGLVGDDGLIEVKSRRPKEQVQTVLSDSVPIENMAQLQAGLLVSGRQWCDYISYCGGMHMFVKRVYPDPRWQKAIVAAVRTFEDKATEMVALYKEATHGLVMTERVVKLEMSL